MNGTIVYPVSVSRKTFARRKLSFGFLPVISLTRSLSLILSFPSFSLSPSYFILFSSFDLERVNVPTNHATHDTSFFFIYLTY